MEGPTPVSALIHAATMVTAGVYLIVRTGSLFEQAPKVLELSAGLGAITIVMAGLIALVQVDIKRVIAYSTMSQIGYMFLAAGLGAYPNAMFHLMTHAFFKALLFMAAGLVIHALAGEQDMRKMGGLNRLLPFTYVCFAIGSLSLAGIPPFAGFFSKDSILAAALDHGWYGELLWVAGMVGTFLTGLYAFRMLFIVFWGEPSAFVREHLTADSHSGEGPLSMTSTVGTLTVLTVIGGFLQFANVWTPVTNWLDPVARPLVEASGTQEAVSSILAVLLGAGRHRHRLVDLRRAQDDRAAQRLGAEPARAQVLLRRGLRLRVLPAGGLPGHRAHALGRAAARVRVGARARAGSRPGRARHGSAADRPRPHLRARDRGERRRPDNRLRGGAMTTALIFLPVAGALLVMLLPLRPFAVGATALLVALAEVALWIDTVARFDFNKPGLQLEEQHTWFSDLHVSYHVGFYGFSLWLVGLTAVVLAAAIGYAFWAGRERPRAYYGLMLLLTGALVGVFVSQDLLLFYVFWEAMLVPLYFLVGVWGGAGRLRATLLFVIYTMAGSLLMLAAIIALGLSQGTFDLVHSGTSNERLDLPRLRRRLRGQGAALPVPRLAARAYRESSPEVAAVLSGVVSKAAAYGFLRIAIAKFPGPVSDFRTPILVLAACGLIYGSLLAFRAPDLRGVIAYSSLAQMGLITLGLFAVNDLGLNGAVLQMVNHGLISASLFLLAGGIERRAATGELAALGGMARGRPALATVLMTTGVIALAVPGLDRLRWRVRDPGRRLPDRLGLRGRRRRGDRARGDVHAAADLRGAAPVAGTCGHRCRTRPAAGRAGDRRPAGGDPARALGLAGSDHRALVRRLPGGVDREAGAAVTLATLSTPPIDWFALSPALALLAAGGVNLLCAVLVPRGDRRIVTSVVCALGFAGALVAGALLFAHSADGHGVIADAIQRDRLGALTTMIIAGSGVLAVGDVVRGADERRPHRRVLRAARLGRRGDGLPQHRELAADALPRARVVLDQPLHPLRDRPRADRLARGRAQVPDRRRLRLGDAALRLGARLRRDRAARVPRDRAGRPAAGPEPRRAARARARADDRRARLQGLGSAVPHVDAGRLRGRADAGDRVHVGRDEGGRARRDAARAHDRLPAGGAPLDDRDRRDRLHLARGRQPGGARADAASSGCSPTRRSRTPASC